MSDQPIKVTIDMFEAVDIARGKVPGRLKRFVSDALPVEFAVAGERVNHIWRVYIERVNHIWRVYIDDRGWGFWPSAICGQDLWKLTPPNPDHPMCKTCAKKVEG